MPQRNANIALFSIFVVVIPILTGCGPTISAARIAVEFEGGIQGLQQGDQVYMLGLPVGEVGKPYIQRGKAIVPMSLRDGSVLGQNNRVSFFIAADQMRIGRQCLVGTIDTLPVEVGKTRFRGFSSRTSLTLQLGVDKAQLWWHALGVSK